jgi:hypothetical protein
MVRVNIDRKDEGPMPELKHPKKLLGTDGHSSVSSQIRMPEAPADTIITERSLVTERGLVVQDEVDV